MFLDVELSTLLIVALAMGVGGLVKGLSAFGLPFVTVPALVQVFPAPTAIAITVLPILCTNGYLMVRGGHMGVMLRRLWPMIVPLIVVLFFSLNLLVSAADSALVAVIGFGILVYVTSAYFGIEIPVKPSHERWIAPLMGASSGIIGGLTSFYGMPSFFYIVALRLDKDQFVCAVSMTLFAGASIMLFQLSKLDVLNRNELILSTVSLIPLFLGLFIGQKLRSKVDQAKFQKIVLFILGLLGISLIVRGLF